MPKCSPRQRAHMTSIANNPGFLRHNHRWRSNGQQTLHNLPRGSKEAITCGTELTAAEGEIKISLNGCQRPETIVEIGKGCLRYIERSLDNGMSQQRCCWIPSIKGVLGDKYGSIHIERGTHIIYTSRNNAWAETQPSFGICTSPNLECCSPVK